MEWVVVYIRISSRPLVLAWASQAKYSSVDPHVLPQRNRKIFTTENILVKLWWSGRQVFPVWVWDTSSCTSIIQYMTGKLGVGANIIERWKKESRNSYMGATYLWQPARLILEQNGSHWKLVIDTTGSCNRLDINLNSPCPQAKLRWCIIHD